MLTVVAYNEVSLRASREQEVRQIAQNTAEQTALELDRIKAGSQSLLEAISSAPVIVSRNWIGCEEFLARLQQRVPQYLSLTVIDEMGFARCRSGGTLPEINFADRPYFQDALARPLSIVVADYTVSRLSGAKALPLSFAFGPDDGRMVAVAALDLMWLQRLIEDRQIPKDGSLTIADRGGIIIARTPLAEKFVGTEIPDAFKHLLSEAAPGTLEVKSQDGTERYLGYVPIAASPVGLYISVGIGKAASFEEINAATLRTALITILALTITVLLVTLLASSLVSGPIRRVERAIDARRSGDHTARTNLQRGQSEINDLGATFDDYMDEMNAARKKQAAAEEHRDLLADELAHRLKNLIAMVQALAGQTFRKGGDPKVLLLEFEGRLQSIAAAQQLLIAANPDHVSLRETIMAAVAPFEEQPGRRFMLSGPDLRIKAKASLTMALACHELSTNAMKYGALKVEEGHVSISWHPERDDLVIKWVEAGGPIVEAPQRRGFGSRLIEQVLSAELSGSAELHYEPSGLHCRIVAPLHNFVDGAEPVSRSNALEAATGP